MKITIKYIPNILYKEGRKIKRFLPGGDHLSLKSWLDRSRFDYKNSRVLLTSPTRKIYSQCIKAKSLNRYILRPGDEVIIVPHVEDPVFTFFYAAALWLGATETVAWTTAAVLTVLTVAATVASMGYSIYSAMQTPRMPNFDGGSGIDANTSTYTWSGPQTTQDIGIPIPVGYGRHKVGGNIINQYVSYDGDKSYLNLLICLGQGPINSISDIKINDNPIENFSEVSIITRLGTVDPAVIPGFEDLHNEYTVSANLVKGDSYIRTTINDDVEAFELAMELPGGLYQQDENGALGSWSVTYQVEYKLSTSGTWIDLGATTINGMSRAALRRTFRKDGLTPGRYDIRITRTSDDSSLTPIKNGDLVLYTVDEIQTEDLIYPNLALLAIKALATDQLSGSRPNVTSIVEQLLVSAPDIRNGGVAVDWEDYYWDPDYNSGVGAYRLLVDDTVLSWDGVTYVDSWTANPIWCIKNALVNDRYGLGDFIDISNIPDSEYLYMSRVCEQKVADGNGGYEKLYRLDVVIDSLSGALDILSQLATVFDAFLFYSQDSVRIKIDEDEDPVQLFGMGNTYPQTLKQSWKSMRDQYNCIDVQFADKDKEYVLETVSIIDDAAIAAGEPFKRKSVRLHTTGLSYAIRAGRRALNVAKYINRSFSISAGIDSIAVAAGDPIGLSHDTPGIGFSGRIKTESTDTSIVLDQEVTIETGKTYKLLIQFNDDDVLEERTINNSPGTTDTITVSSAFSKAPSEYDRYAFGEDLIHYKKLRVIGFAIDTNLDVQIEASEMDSRVYDYTAPVLPETNYSMLTRDIPDVIGLTISEMVIKAKDGSIINTIEVWFRKPQVATYYLNPYHKAKIFISDDSGESWKHAGDTSDAHFVINEGVITGTNYRIAVVSVAQNGMENAIADSPYSSITILGKAAPPSNVTNFDVSQQGDKLHFSWSPIPDGDLARYVIKKGNDWATGDFVAEKVDVTEFDWPIGSIGEETYMLKAVDTSENESVSPAYDTLVVSPPPDMNFAVEIDPWSFNREYKLTNVSVEKLELFNPGYARDVFSLTTAATWESIEGTTESWDKKESDGTLNDNKTVQASGNWEQIEPYDLLTIFEFKIVTSLQFKNVSGGSITVQVATSEDNVTWSDFANVNASTNYRARYLKFKFLLATSDTNYNVWWYSATIFINAATVKKDWGRDLLIAAGGTAVNFRGDFTAAPRITALVVKNNIIGLAYAENVTAAGMTIHVVDPATKAGIGTAEVDWECAGS